MKQRISQLTSASRAHAERGAVMFLAAMMILIVMIGGAIAVDLSLIATRGQSLQNAADSAALAGVQALRESMGEEIEASPEDEQAAIDAVNALLTQNGINDLTPVIEFPDAENDTEVRVTLLDNDPGLLLSGFSGVDGSVERTATARFERCESGCIQEITIPEPFRAVNTIGDGDGYKPIPVGNKLYALNHNSTALQIVCVDRSEPSDDPDDIEKDGLCWDNGFDGDPARSAYPDDFEPPATPEMPNTAVVESRIFWTVSVNSGHYLFCFETITDSPCSTPYRINRSARVTWNPSRIENRGGGTFTPGDGNVYTFTDDHRVHCIWPHDEYNPITEEWEFVMEACDGYENNGVTTGLGDLRNDDDPTEWFPVNDPSLGNHGSSIDRIYDSVEGKVYHTFHIDRVPGPPAYCASLPHQNSRFSGVVVLKNAQTGLYLSVSEDGYDVVDGDNAQAARSQWQVLSGAWNSSYGYERVYVFRSISTNKYLRINSADPNWGESLELVDYDWHRYDSVFVAEHGEVTSRIKTWQNHYDDDGDQARAYLSQTTDLFADPIHVFIAGDAFPDNSAADWIVRPAECEVEQKTFGGVTYEAGTFIDCFDLNLHLPCTESVPAEGKESFVPSKIHNDWDSFSGRLFFHFTDADTPVATGVCSTGFTEHWEWTNMADATDFTCIDIDDGTERGDLENSMPQFVAALAGTNTGDQGWGTWGDPHYNAHTNRLFFPTNRRDSKVLCWDFDDGAAGWCGERHAISALGEIQDYGFFSEGNCVYGLGHNAIFWAFKADNIYEECSGSSAVASIRPCDCGGDLYWGTLNFDVDLPAFGSFLIELHDTPDGRGNRVYPPENWVKDPNATKHSLHHHGSTIDLNYLEAERREQRLWITVTVESDGDPWAEGDQTFTVEFERTPRLTNGDTPHSG